MRSRIVALATTVLLVTACGEGGAQTATESTETKLAETKERVAKKETKQADKTSTDEKRSLTSPKSCPVTLPGTDPFTPASKAPPGPPEVYDAVWYGTPQLYTMLGDEGNSDKRWLGGGDKTFWWSEGFSVEAELEPEITVTAQRLDGKATYEASQATHAMIKGMKDAMLVGVELPEPGCWEVTATHQAASLGYVVWVEEKS